MNSQWSHKKSVKNTSISIPQHFFWKGDRTILVLRRTIWQSYAWRQLYKYVCTVSWYGMGAGGPSCQNNPSKKLFWSQSSWILSHWVCIFSEFSELYSLCDYCWVNTKPINCQKSLQRGHLTQAKEVKAGGFVQLFGQTRDLSLRNTRCINLPLCNFFGFDDKFTNN